jgi:hypothetical protein
MIGSCSIFSSQNIYFCALRCAALCCYCSAIRQGEYARMLTEQQQDGEYKELIASKPLDSHSEKLARSIEQNTAVTGNPAFHGH